MEWTLVYASSSSSSSSGADNYHIGGREEHLSTIAVLVVSIDCWVYTLQSLLCLPSTLSRN